MVAKSQENAGEWVQCASGMQGMQGNTRGMYRIGCKVPGECRGMKGNEGECRGMPGECKVVGAMCQGNAGFAGECQGNV